MGIELVKTVAACCGHLKGNEFKVLVYMASTALDRPNDKGQPAHLYYAGWEPLAIAVDAKGSDRAKYETVRRALNGLECAGLITRTQDHPRAGTRQSFHIASPSEIAGLAPLGNSGAGSQQNSGAEPLGNVGTSPSEIAGPRKTQEDLGPNSGPITHHQAHLTRARCDVCRHDKFADGECLRCQTPTAVVA